MRACSQRHLNVAVGAKRERRRTSVEAPDDAVRRCRDGVISDGVSLPVVPRDGLASAAAPLVTSSDNNGAGVISGDGSGGCTRSVESRRGADCSNAAGEPAMGGVSADAAGCRLDSLEGLRSHMVGCASAGAAQLGSSACCGEVILTHAHVGQIVCGKRSGSSVQALQLAGVPRASGHMNNTEEQHHNRCERKSSAQAGSHLLRLARNDVKLPLRRSTVAA